MWKNIPDGWKDMDEDERKDAAFAKGEQDYADCGGQVDDPITETVFPNYDPPEGYEDEYAEGWKNARSQA